MPDYITKESVHTMVRHLTKFAWASPVNNERRITVDTDDVHFGIDKIPAADMAPVVRCRDCAHLFGTLCAVCGLLPRQPDDFCSRGERKDGADHDT